eukprot:SAG31_NODE_5790_length_2327_cov_1.929982_4_plen_64_part_00
MNSQTYRYSDRAFMKLLQAHQQEATPCTPYVAEKRLAFSLSSFCLPRFSIEAFLDDDGLLLSL